MFRRPDNRQITDMTHSIIRSFYGGMSSLILEQLHSDIVWINNLTSQCLYGYYSVSSSLFKTPRTSQCRISFGHSHLMNLSTDAFIVSCEYTVHDANEPDQAYCSSFIWKASEENMKLIYVHMSPLAFPSPPAGILSISGRHAEVYRIHTQDILYIEASNVYSKICCRSSHIMASQSISSIEKLLPPFFMRTHRSFIVNKQYVRRIFRYGMELSNGAQLPVPEKRYMKVVCWLET